MTNHKQPLRYARSVCTENDLTSRRLALVRSLEIDTLETKNFKACLAELDRAASRVYTFQPDILRRILLRPPINRHPCPDWGNSPHRLTAQLLAPLVYRATHQSKPNTSKNPLTSHPYQVGDE